MKSMNIVIILFIYLQQQFACIFCETFAECLDVSTLTFVASKQDCRKYIFCDGDDSYEGECDVGDYFNAIYQTCDPEDVVVCRLEQITQQTENEIESTTTTTTITPITTTTTITMQIYENSTTTIIPIITATSSTTTTTTIATTAIISAQATNICPILKDPQRMLMLKNPNSCTEYYICYQGLAIRMRCSATLHFNAVTGKCDFPQRAKCQVN